MRAADLLRTLKVGLFVFVGFAAVGLVIFMLGRERSMFSKKVVFYAYFPNISGLVIGAPVRLAGLDMGTVTDIEFEPDLKVREVKITMSIDSSYLERIRADSRASIDSKGLLGDKLINITVGAQAEPPLVDGTFIKINPSIELTSMAEDAQKAIRKITQTVEDISRVINDIATDQVRQDVGHIVSSMAGILKEVEGGRGIVGHLIYDQHAGSDFSVFVNELSKATKKIRGAMDKMDNIIGRVESGPGTLHQIVYGEEGKKLLTELSAASADVAAVVKEIKDGNGVIHSLIYTEEGQNLLKQLTDFSTRLNSIAKDVQDGKGTLGGLVADPTVYEDLKTILGNIKRNRLFKALVRYTITNEGLERTGEVNGPAPAPAAAQQ